MPDGVVQWFGIRPATPSLRRSLWPLSALMTRFAS